MISHLEAGAGSLRPCGAETDVRGPVEIASVRVALTAGLFEAATRVERLRDAAAASQGETTALSCGGPRSGLCRGVRAGPFG